MGELSSKLEDYLEAILVVQQEKKVARVKDLSEILMVKPPTVNSAIKKLERLGLVEHQNYGYISLTPKGEEIAQCVYERHKTLLSFLVKVLGVDPKKALAQACGMEHSINEFTRNKIQALSEFFACKPEILKLWRQFCDERKKENNGCGGGEP